VNDVGPYLVQQVTICAHGSGDAPHLVRLETDIGRHNLRASLLVERSESLRNAGQRNHDVDAERAKDTDLLICPSGAHRGLDDVQNLHG
jgi:hypothetical protein